MNRAGPTSAGRHRPIVGLDLLRFLAAALVMTFHLGCTSWMDVNSEAADLLAGAARYPALLSFSRSGWVGVQMFFVISGFVIAYSAHGSTASRFFESRFLRLMPGVWICATISVALGLAFSHDGASALLVRYLRTLVLSPAFRTIDGVYWTLPIEIVFYAVVWALLARGRLALLEPVMLGVGLVSSAVWLVVATGHWPWLEALGNKRVPQLLLITHGSAFALGVLAWRMAQAGLSAGRLLGVVCCVAGTLAQIAASQDITFRELGLGAPDHLVELLFGGFLALFAVAIVCNEAVLARLSPRTVGQIRLLGMSTYPLYLLHTFVGALSIRAARHLGVDDGAALLIGFLVPIGVAIVVARFVEPRVRRAVAVGLTRVLRWAPGRAGRAAVDVPSPRGAVSG